MEQKQLISQLVTDLQPVRRVRWPWLALSWVVLAALIGWWFLWSVGMRADVVAKFQSWGYMASSWVFGMATLVSGFLCFRSGIPGALTLRQNRRARLGLFIAAGVALVAYGGLYGSIPAFSRSFVIHDALGCCLRITKGLGIPAVVLLALTSRLAPTRTWSTAWYAVGAGTFLTSLVSQLNCPIDNAWHIMIGHGAMVAVTSGLVLWVLGIAMHVWKRRSGQGAH